jgi:hypothetical protein
VASLLTLGSALAGQGLLQDAAVQLREAVERSEGAGGSPLLRWRAQAALGALPGHEHEREREAAVAIIHEVVDGLAPERAARYLAAPQVARVLDMPA